MEHGITLTWRPGAQNQLPEDLSHLLRFSAPGNDTDDSLPGHESSKNAYRGPQGPVLDRVPLSTLGVEDMDNSDATPLGVVAVVGVTPTLSPRSRARPEVYAAGGGHARL